MKTEVNVVAFLALFTSGVCAYKNELDYSFPSGPEVVTSPQPKFTKDTPTSVDYRSDGLLTTDLNQHIPVYCGSCWAHSAMSSLGDRLKIMNKGKGRDIIPSVQALINCGHAGSCNGGNPGAANREVYRMGVPDVTCQQYQAKNMECSAINTCMNCDHDTNECSPVKTYPIIRVSEFGTVRGDENIMAEIASRGPVSVAINANCIEDYTGGIIYYGQDTDCKTGSLHNNHAVQLNGYGTDEDGVEFWIGRNSWGTYWGEEGFFRIARSTWSPGEANWAVPYMDYFNGTETR